MLGFPVPSQEDGSLRNPKLQAVSSFTATAKQIDSKAFQKMSSQLHPKENKGQLQENAAILTTVLQKDDMGSMEVKLWRAMVNFLGTCL